jgi:predicted transcriptional regulator
MPNDNPTDHTDSALGLRPEDLNYPETLRITISSGEDAFTDALDAAAAAEAGEQTDAVVSFETTEGIRRLLTDRRLELLESLMGAPAASISALADRLDRSYSAVHDDVEMLAEYSIVEFRQQGQSKQPFVPYETIEFDVTIRAQTTGNDAEAPV